MATPVAVKKFEVMSAAGDAKSWLGWVERSAVRRLVSHRRGAALLRNPELPLPSSNAHR